MNKAQSYLLESFKSSDILVLTMEVKGGKFVFETTDKTYLVK